MPTIDLLEDLRWLVSGLCAQMPGHIFALGGELLPLCARDTGIYLGFLATLVGIHSSKRGRAQFLPPLPVSLVLAGGVVTMAIDGTNSWLLDLGLPHLYQPNNDLRLATGLLTGLALAAFAQPLFNRLCWCEYNEQKSIARWKDLFFLIPLLVVCFCAVLSQNGLFLYPIALLSTGGLVLALSHINLIVLISISKREMTFVDFRQLRPFFGLAIVLAPGELLILAEIKIIMLQMFGVGI